MESGNALFEIAKAPDDQPPSDLPPDAGRFVSYQFPPEFLRLGTVGATYVRENTPLMCWLVAFGVVVLIHTLTLALSHTLTCAHSKRTKAYTL